MKVSELKFDLLEASRDIVRDTIEKESATADIKINNALKIQMERYENAISSLATKLEEEFHQYLITTLEVGSFVENEI